jgi:putative ABC transport system substrate-binding protein
MLLGGAVVACPFAARAQQTGKLPTVAYVHYRTTVDPLNRLRTAFTERLRELGWIEGRTVAIDDRWSEGPPDVAEIAAELVQQKVRVIFSYGAAVATLKQATTSIPIVTVANDPVGSGFVATKRFRRICFVVDRSALGDQAAGEFSTTKIVSEKPLPISLASSVCMT